MGCGESVDPPQGTGGAPQSRRSTMLQGVRERNEREDRGGSGPEVAATRIGLQTLELHQIELRHEALRTRDARRERKLLASIAESGQRTPIVVVREGTQFVLVDGFKRVRALRRLSHDTVSAIEWALAEPDALLLERSLRAGEADSAIEQGWFLREMHGHFGLSYEELARRFDRTVSWVSRRIGLVAELPTNVQSHVRDGAIGAHAAMKFLVPLARANAVDCTRLADAVAPEKLTDRQLGELYGAYVGGNGRTRELVVSTPMVVLRAREEAKRKPSAEKAPIEQLLDDLHIVAAVARRAHGRVRQGVLAGTDPSEWQRVRNACSDAAAMVESVRRRCDKEVSDARPEHTDNDSTAA